MARPDKSRKVVFWDFHGTLAHAPQEWGAAMLELLDETVPGHGIDRETMFGFIQEGFPWHTRSGRTRNWVRPTSGGSMWRGRWRADMDARGWMAHWPAYWPGGSAGSS